MNRRSRPIRAVAFITASLLGGCHAPPHEASPPRGPEAPPPTPAPPPPRGTEPPPPDAPRPPVPSSEPPPPQSDPALVPAAGFRELFPGVRADLAERVVEFDGFAAVFAHDPRTPHVYLEQVACTRNTREHESLVVTDVRPSHIHAALLLIGLTPGHPTRWEVVNNRLTATPPAGDRVRIELVYTDENGAEHAVEPAAWIVNAKTGEHFPAANAEHGWVFGGSRIVERPPPTPDGEPITMYDADGAGTVIGLTSFGSEVVDWSTPISPEAQVTPPEWIIDTSVYPDLHTPIVVRIRPEK